MTRRAKNFLAANAQSPVVYGSAAGNGMTYRLANGKVFNLSALDAKQAGHPLWVWAA